MDKVLCWVCILLCALGLVWPVMRIEECVHAAGREALHDTLRAQELLAGLYRDPRFEESIGRGASAPIRFEEDALADAARERFGEDLVLTVLVTERYLRIDRGAGLGPPLYYWDEKDGVLRWFRRGLDLCQRDGQIVACEPAERKAAIARIEEGLGLGRS